MATGSGNYNSNNDSGDYIEALNIGHDNDDDDEEEHGACGGRAQDEIDDGGSSGAMPTGRSDYTTLSSLPESVFLGSSDNDSSISGNDLQLLYGFHRRCGNSITLSNENRTAKRSIRDFSHALVFSNEPLIDDVLFEVVIDNKNTTWGGSIEIGITSESPEHMQIPSCAAVMRNGTYIMSGAELRKNGTAYVSYYGRDLETLNETDRVGVMVTSDDELIFYVNGLPQGVAAQNVSKPIWALVDLYGSCVKVSLCPVIKESLDSYDHVLPAFSTDFSVMPSISNGFATTLGATMADVNAIMSSNQLNGNNAQFAREQSASSTPPLPPQPCNSARSDNSSVITFDTNTTQSSANSSANEHNYDMNDRLRFHKRSGSLVKFSANCRTAERRRPLDEFNNGVVMTHRPLNDNELFEIRIDKLVDKWSGSIEVGVTTHNPSVLFFPATMTNMRSGTIMMSGCGILTNGKGTRRQYGEFNLDELREGDRVGMMRKSNNNLHYYINGQDQGVAATRVASTLWGVIDLYGMTIKVTIVDRDERESQNLVIRRNNLAPTAAIAGTSALNVGGVGVGCSNNAIPTPAFNLPSPDNDVINSSSAAFHSSAEEAADADESGLACGGSNLHYDDRLTFHLICGTHASVSRNGRKAYRPNASDDFNNGVVLTRRPLRPNELFQVRLDRVVTKWAGSVELGVTTFSADELDFPFTMTNVRSGTWMMTGNGVMHNGITVIEQYGQNLDRLQVGDRVGVVRKDDGTLHFWVNGIDQGPAAYNVPENVYGVIDLYGQAAQASIVDSSEVGSPDTANSTISNTTLYSEPPLRFHSIHGKNAGISNGGLTATRPNSQAEFNEAIVFGSRPLRQRELFEVVIEVVVPHWSGNIEIGIISTRPEDLQLAANATDLKAPDTTILCGHMIFHNTKTIRSNSMIDLDTLGVGARVGVMRIGEAIHFFIDGIDQGEAAECRAPNIWPVVDLYGQCAQVSLTQQQPNIRAPYATSENSQSCQATSVLQPTSLETKHRWTCFSGNVNLSHNWTMATRGSGCQAALTHATVFSEHPLTVGAPFEIKITAYNPMFAGCLNIGVTDLNLTDSYVRSNIPLDIKGIAANVWYLSGNDVCHNSTVVHRGLVSLDWLRKGDRIALELTAARTLRVYINSEDIHVNFQDLPSEVYVVMELAGSTTGVQVISYQGPISPLRPFSLRLQDSLDFGGDSLNKQDSMLESIESENYEFIENVHGSNINLMDNHKRALRTQSFHNGIVFINKPLCRGDSISIKVEAIVETWNGSIGLGVIGICPQLLLANNALPVPSNIMHFGRPCWLATDRFINIHGQTAASKYGAALENIQIGSIVTMSLSHNGILSITIIDKSAHNLGDMATNLPNHVYPVFDLYGRCEKISLVSQSEMTQQNGTPILEEVYLDLDKEQATVIVKEVVESIVQHTLDAVLKPLAESEEQTEEHNTPELNEPRTAGGSSMCAGEQTNAPEEPVEIVKIMENPWTTLLNLPEIQSIVNTPRFSEIDGNDNDNQNENDNDNNAVENEENEENVCEWLRRPATQDSTHIPEPVRHTNKLQDGLRINRQYTNRWDWMNQPIIQRYLNSPSSQLPCHSNIVEGAVDPATIATTPTTTDSNNSNTTTNTTTTAAAAAEVTGTTTTTTTTAAAATTTAAAAATIIEMRPQTPLLPRPRQRFSRAEKATYDGSEKSMLQMPRYDFSPPPPQRSTPSNYELNRSVVESLEDNLLRNLDIRRRTSEQQNNNNNNNSNTTSSSAPAIVPISPSSSSSSACCLQESLQLQHNLNLNIQRSQSTQRFTNSFNALVTAATGIASSSPSTTTATTSTSTSHFNNYNNRTATTSTSTICTMSTSATPILTAMEYFTRLREICRSPTFTATMPRMTASLDSIVENNTLETSNSSSTSTNTTSTYNSRRCNNISMADRSNIIDSNRELYCNRHLNFSLPTDEVQMTENGLMPIRGNRELESQNFRTISERRVPTASELHDLITADAQQLNSLCDELNVLCDDEAFIARMRSVDISEDDFMLDPDADIVGSEDEEEVEDNDEDDDVDDNDEEDDNDGDNAEEDEDYDDDDDNEDGDDDEDDDQDVFRLRIHVTDDSDDTDNGEDRNEHNNTSDMDSDVNSNDHNNARNSSANDNNDRDDYYDEYNMSHSANDNQHDNNENCVNNRSANDNYGIVRESNEIDDDDDDLVESAILDHYNQFETCIILTSCGSGNVQENNLESQERLTEFTRNNIRSYVELSNSLSRPHSLPFHNNEERQLLFRGFELDNGEEKNVIDQNETEHKVFNDEDPVIENVEMEEEMDVMELEEDEQERIVTEEVVIEKTVEELEIQGEEIVVQETLEEEMIEERLESKIIVEDESLVEGKEIVLEEKRVEEEQQLNEEEKVEEQLIEEEEEDEEERIKEEEKVEEEQKVEDQNVTDKRIEEEKNVEKQTQTLSRPRNRRIYLTEEELDEDLLIDIINPAHCTIVDNDSDNSEEYDNTIDDNEVHNAEAAMLGVSPLVYEMMLLNEAHRKARACKQDEDESESSSSCTTSCRISHGGIRLENASAESVVDVEQSEVQSLNVVNEQQRAEEEQEEEDLSYEDITDDDDDVIDEEDCELDEDNDEDIEEVRRESEQQVHEQDELEVEDQPPDEPAQLRGQEVEEVERTPTLEEIEQMLMDLPILPPMRVSSPVVHVEELDGVLSDNSNWITEEEEAVVGDSEIYHKRAPPVSQWNGAKLPLDVPAKSYEKSLRQLLVHPYISCQYFQQIHEFCQSLLLPCMYVDTSRNVICFCMQCNGKTSKRMRGWTYFKLNADMVNRKSLGSVSQLESCRGTWLPLYYMTSVEHVRTILDLGHLLPHDFHKQCERSPGNDDVPKEEPSRCVKLHVSPNAQTIPLDQPKLLTYLGQKFHLTTAFEVYVRRQALRRKDMTADLNYKQTVHKPSPPSMSLEMQRIADSVQQLLDDIERDRARMTNTNLVNNLEIDNRLDNSQNEREIGLGEAEEEQLEEHQDEEEEQLTAEDEGNEEEEWEEGSIYEKEEEDEDDNEDEIEDGLLGEEEESKDCESNDGIPDVTDVNDAVSSLSISSRVEEAIIEMNGERTEQQPISGLHVNFRAMTDAEIALDSNEELDISEDLSDGSIVIQPHGVQLNVAAIAASAICDAPLKERIWYTKEAGACVITAVMFKLEPYVSSDEETKLQDEPSTSKKTTSSKISEVHRINTVSSTLAYGLRRRGRSRRRCKRLRQIDRPSSSGSRSRVLSTEAIADRQRPRRKRYARTAKNNLNTNNPNTTDSDES